MPLRLVRSSTNETLWAACASGFLDELDGGTGPGDHASYLWLAHRSQRDAVLELAARRGLPGWLAPPISFLSELRELFDIRERPLGILTGRLLVARLAEDVGRRHGFGGAARDRGPARAHMLDGVFSELLPEGVAPGELRRALYRLGGDAFSRRRNDWVADTYEAFHREVESGARYDPRSIHAKVAERVEAGGLRHALRGARNLHIYGITSLRGRRRLFTSLAEQGEVLVSVYLPLENEPSEWEETLPVETVDVLAPREGPEADASAAVAGNGASPAAEPAPEAANGASPAAEPGDGASPASGPAGAAGEGASPPVKPAPDAIREAAWVARRVKALLAAGEAEPHEVAVVARSGRRDTRLFHRALADAGVPSTARLRAPLAEVPCLGAVLSLFRAEAAGWDYRSLRQVLASPYFRIGIDLRAIDWLSGTRRLEGLDAWEAALDRSRGLLEGDRSWMLEREGVYADRLEEDRPKFAAFRRRVASLGTERTERGWIALTLEVLEGEWFDFRRRLCRPAGDRWDVVRLDQRAASALRSLLREWDELVDSRQEFGAEEWHDRLRRLLEANELALSTPLQTGVQVVEAHEAALTPYRHTFMVHANDGVFPRTGSPGGVFSEAERHRLRELGLPLTNRELALRRERTLWRAVAAGRKVTITYRTTDVNGVPRLPSLMVPEHDPKAAIPRTLERETDQAGAALAPVSEAGHRRSEVRRLARLRRGGDRSRFATPDPARVRQAVLAAFAEELRAGRLDGFFGAGSVSGLERPISRRPHPWNGRLRDPVVLAELRRRFGEDYLWSASQLQTYGLRPFDFLLDRVLRLGEVEEAEEETTPLAFGSVAHALLERFYREVLHDVPAAFDDRAAEIYDRVAEEVFREIEGDPDRWLGLPAVWAATREDVRDKVREFLARDLEKLAKHDERPILVEVAFGEGGSSGVEIAGLDVRGRPARLWLRGRIDRIDRCGRGGTPFHRVVDYKTGSIPSPTGYGDGALLQTALYMKAAEVGGFDTPEPLAVRNGVFRSIKYDTRNGAPLERKDLDAVLALALSIPARVREGMFEAVQAGSTKISDWQPGRDLTRTEARLESGSRFDPPAAGEEPVPGGAEVGGAEVGGG